MSKNSQKTPSIFITWKNIENRKTSRLTGIILLDKNGLLLMKWELSLPCPGQHLFYLNDYFVNVANKLSDNIAPFSYPLSFLSKTTANSHSFFFASVITAELSNSINEIRNKSFEIDGLNPKKFFNLPECSLNYLINLANGSFQLPQDCNKFTSIQI